MRTPQEDQLRDGDVLPYMSGAFLVDDELPTVRRILGELGTHAGIPPPRLWLEDSPIPNAMVTGTSAGTAAVTLSSGLLLHLDQRDLRAVLAHEVGHIVHGHVATKTSAAMELARRAGLIAAGAIGGAWALAELFDFGGLGSLAMGGLGFAVGGMAGNAADRKLAQLGRSTELEADAFAAGAGGSPSALGSALRKLDVVMARAGSQVPDWQRVLSIIEPVDAYATHPPTSERLTNLGVAAATRVLTCPNCWYDEDSAVSYCRRCGSELVARLCRGCARQVHSADRICIHCGQARPTGCWLCERPTSDRFCSYCGAEQRAI